MRVFCVVVGTGGTCALPVVVGGGSGYLVFECVPLEVRELRRICSCWNLRRYGSLFGIVVQRGGNGVAVERGPSVAGFVVFGDAVTVVGVEYCVDKIVGVGGEFVASVVFGGAGWSDVIRCGFGTFAYFLFGRMFVCARLFFGGRSLGTTAYVDRRTSSRVRRVFGI